MIEALPCRRCAAVRNWAGGVARVLAIGLVLGLLPRATPAEAKPTVAQVPLPMTANFRGAVASRDAHRLADWIVASSDNHRMPFLILDKVAAKVFLFDQNDQILGSAPALLGLARGDDSVPGIGHRRLATIANEERTTAAGRFEAALGHDFEQDVLWIDYDAGLSLHRVITGNPKDHRHERLLSPTPLDNRISYGCINVPVVFYDKMVVPAFSGTVGIVYIMPETKPLEAVFAMLK